MLIIYSSYYFIILMFSTCDSYKCDGATVRRCDGWGEEKKKGGKLVTASEAHTRSVHHYILMVGL